MTPTCGNSLMESEMEDIVERLRAWNGTPFDDEAREAATEIEALRLRVEEFTFLIKAIKGYV